MIGAEGQCAKTWPQDPSPEPNRLFRFFPTKSVAKVLECGGFEKRRNCALGWRGLAITSTPANQRDLASGATMAYSIVLLTSFSLNMMPCYTSQTNSLCNCDLGYLGYIAYEWEKKSCRQNKGIWTCTGHPREQNKKKKQKTNKVKMFGTVYTVYNVSQ